MDGFVLRLIAVTLSTLLMCGCGVRSESISPSASRPSNVSETYSTLQAGSWSDGPEYEQIQDLLSKSNAHIRLDAKQGIEWYDGSTKSWQTLDSIEAVQKRLNVVADKSLVCIATGKALWDKESEYTNKIAEYARQERFDATVVTTDHSSALVITQVIHHRKQP